MKISDQGTVAKILKNSRIVAVVGLSKNPEKDSHKVAGYLQAKGYRIVPVNPNADEILGEKAYKNLSEIPIPVDVVDVFRPSAEAGQTVDDAIKFGAKAVWMQVGIIDDSAAERASNAGLDVVMDLCMMIEHRRLERMWI
jgi:predicted CoA-binding protein